MWIQIKTIDDTWLNAWISVFAENLQVCEFEETRLFMPSIGYREIRFNVQLELVDWAKEGF